MTQYVQYANKLKTIFEANNMKPMLSTQLKERLLGANENLNESTVWGNLLSTLITLKILQKTTESERINGRRVFYYRMGSVSSTPKTTSIPKIVATIYNNLTGDTYIVVDEETVSSKIEELRKNNPNYSFTVLEPTRILQEKTLTPKLN